jgi:hypothetical protein
MHVVALFLMQRGVAMAMAMRMVTMVMRPSIVVVATTVVVVATTVVVVATTVVVVVAVSVCMIDRGMLPFDTEFRCRDACSRDALGPDRRRRDREAAQCAADVLQPHAGVDQRPEHHVTGGTGKAIEVQHLHNLSIVPVP